MPQQQRNITISEEQADEYYSLLMQSDPYPNGVSGHSIAVSIADSIALAFGFSDWIAHYHHFGAQNNGQLKLGEENGL